MEKLKLYVIPALFIACGILTAVLSKPVIIGVELLAGCGILFYRFTTKK